MNDQELVLIKIINMETIKLNKLLLKTAFACMACDGEIDKREVKLIREFHNQHKTFGEVDIDQELDKLTNAINEQGQQFLKDYFTELASAELSEVNELRLIEVAIQTIKADEKIEYSEVKFFKVIRSKLKIKDESILEKHPDFEEYLEQDIMSASYMAKLQDDIFSTQSLPKFDLISKIDEDLLDNLDKQGEG